MRDFLASSFKEGDIIRHEWLEQHFGMPSLSANKPMTPAEFQERQFAWLSNIEAFKAELLETHQIFLETIFGQGYRVASPREQTALALERFEREATKSYRKAARAVKNVRLSELTESERRENSDAIARLSLLRGMHKSALE